jgi:hypothetical protein
METVLDFIRDYEFIIVAALLVVTIILLFMQILNKIELNRMEKRYKKMMKGSSGKSLEEMIMEYKNNIETSIGTVKDVEALYQDMDSRVKKSIQKFAVVRFRAFDDVGSDLSFSIALLDEKNDGFIITGIYGRTECTTFAKPLENGLSKYDLSDEEKLAIKNAINGRG